MAWSGSQRPATGVLFASRGRMRLHWQHDPASSSPIAPQSWKCGHCQGRGGDRTRRAAEYVASERECEQRGVRP